MRLHTPYSLHNILPMVCQIYYLGFALYTTYGFPNTFKYFLHQIVVIIITGVLDISMASEMSINWSLLCTLTEQPKENNNLINNFKMKRKKTIERSNPTPLLHLILVPLSFETPITHHLIFIPPSFDSHTPAFDSHTSLILFPYPIIVFPYPSI